MTHFAGFSFWALVATAILLGSANAQQRQAPGFYRGNIGAFEITVLFDGTAPRQMDQILSKPEIAAAEYAAAHETQPINLPINAYLINTGSHLVLIDTGAGEMFGSGSGMLITNLRASGYSPERIDTILLTHMHADHSGGLSVGGVMQFPNATVYVDQRDLEHFVTRKDSAGDSEMLRRQSAQARAAVGPYLKANRVVPIKNDAEVIPGIRARSQTGHTPGHTSYLVESEGHRMLCWGDIIHSAEVQFEYPDVTVVFDSNPSEAIQARMHQMEFAAEDDILLASTHISFPGLGHVRRTGSAFRWAPIPYSATVVELDQRVK